MKRTFSFDATRTTALVVAGTCLIAGTYGLVRLAYGLFLPDIRESVSMGSAVAGYVSSGASAAYCLGALAGLLAPHRPRALVVGALSTAAVGSTGMALAPGLAVFVPAAVLASCGAGLASPGLVAVVARNVGRPHLDRGQATVNAGTGPGLVGAGLLALLLPDWRAGFAVAAAFTAAAGVAVLLLDRHDPAADDQPQPPTGLTDPRWLTDLAVPAAAAVLLGAASAATWTYGRTHLVEAGASTPLTVVAWIGIGVGGTLTVVTSGRLGALPPPRAWLVTAATAALATAALGLGAGLPVLPVVACVVFGWGFVAASSALIAWTSALVPDRAAAGTSLLFIALVVGQAAGSAVAGVLSGPIGLSGVFVVAAAVTAVAAGCSRAPSPRRSVPAGG
ncbi:MFS transporter [Nocardioides sp. SYSU D00038]|uniref:MFS transporter n=1 Tax=Nocardioides sp. SYSU D00038 TaxID=2812554 RepID=UPI0019685DD7|nr:MFS transporter [Nocardioides sp. SYSU D00038]